MTAGLFSKHGVWTGTCRKGNEWNPKGYFENIPLKHILKAMWPGFIADGMMASPKKGFKDKIESAVKEDGYESGPWLMKHSVLYWRAWSEFNPKWVCVRRDKEEIYNSCKRSRMLAPNHSDQHLRDVINLHDEQLDIVAREHNGKNVYTGELIEGNTKSLEEALEYCGIEFNPEVTRKFINPEYWHG